VDQQLCGQRGNEEQFRLIPFYFQVRLKNSSDMIKISKKNVILFQNETGKNPARANKKARPYKT